MAKSNQKSVAVVKRPVPVAQSTINTNRMPKLSNTTNSTVVSHRELLTTVTSTTVYTPIQFAMQPALSTTFTWLHKIAGGYERYRFRKLKIEYVTASSTSQAGQFSMYFDYDPNDGVAGDIGAFMSMFGAMTTQVWNSVTMTTKPRNDLLFTRNGPTDDSFKLYDFGTLNITATTNTPQLVGYIYLDYEVELQKPHTHLDQYLAYNDQAWARWNNAQTSNVPTATPSQHGGGLVWGTGAQTGQFLIQDTGYYEIEATVSCPLASAIQFVAGSGRALAAATVAQQQMVASVIAYIEAGAWIIPFAINVGTLIGANALLSVKKLRIQDP